MTKVSKSFPAFPFQDTECGNGVRFKGAWLVHKVANRACVSAFCWSKKFLVAFFFCLCSVVAELGLEDVREKTSSLQPTWKSGSRDEIKPLVDFMLVGATQKDDL